LGAKTQRLYIWCGPAGTLVLFAGMLVARLIPLPGPSERATEVAAFYEQHTFAIRLGLLIIMSGSPLFGLWVAAISNQLRQIEGPASPAAYGQLALGGLLVLELLVPLMILETAAFRPNRSPTELLTLSDEAWLMLTGFVFTLVVEMIVIGISVRLDTRDQPIYPRWAATLNVALAFLIAPGGLVVFFKSGPFAWDGLIGFWVPSAAFGVWIVAMTAIMLKVLDRQIGETAGVLREPQRVLT